MKKVFIAFRNVSFRYGEEYPWALKNISFEIFSDEWIAIIGHNGSGKSTIAKLINGLLLPQEGEIIVDGMPVNEETIWDIRKSVGMVFQNPDNQFVGTTVRDDVAFGLENRGIAREEMIQRINDSLDAVGMTDYILHEPHRLSGGQKQRVAIASILAISPEVIILDEATAMLDPKGRHEIMNTVNEVKNKHHLALVAITHDLNEITQADRVIVMSEGEVWLESNPRDVFSRKEELQQIGLDIPFIAKLADDLSSIGVPIKNQPLNHEELLIELWKYHSKM
ncbi:energy-coupling factor ABC transporter ATP-binding protein [Aquibacillus rhizosphaerae]|uniref:Energy-coupling factor ABC transporter ATP-binding protein n=1 Tax=Aquibacillus rhizosphaerae TaxID=3051431 RepID=A0ABT7L7S4_9BACI|nr:energy-coupling factor ABC transporter ATP-binding protein [Aquibacillus sp. LR5S19]MDL4841414.1 energy-coupling factor ABC transporter ATP-binding protein [Aquibacillus sp. LR5S19]